MSAIRWMLSAGWLLAVLLEAGCSPADVAVGGPSTPGWTGRTVVLGNNSTIMGDAVATENQQKWPIGRGR